MVHWFYGPLVHGSTVTSIIILFWMRLNLERVLRSALAYDPNHPAYPFLKKEDGRVVRRLHDLADAVQEAVQSAG